MLRDWLHTRRVQRYLRVFQSEGASVPNRIYAYKQLQGLGCPQTPEHFSGYLRLLIDTVTGTRKLRGGHEMAHDELVKLGEAALLPLMQYAKPPIGVLIEIWGVEWVDKLVDALLHYERPELRRAAAQFFGGCYEDLWLEKHKERKPPRPDWVSAVVNNLRVIPAVISAVADSDQKVKSSSVWSLGQIRDRRATDCLAPAVSDFTAHMESF